MPPNPPPAVIGPYRYLVLFASGMMLAVGTGSMFALAISLKDIAAEFGWPRTVPPLGYSLQFIGAGLGGIAMGHLLDRSGMGKPALIGAVMIGAGAIVTSQIDSAWQLYIAYGVMGALFAIGCVSWFMEQQNKVAAARATADPDPARSAP